MADLAPTIAALRDDEAVHMVASIAQAQRGVVEVPAPSPDLASALREEFAAAPEVSQVNDGELARAALSFLAEDPDYRPAIEARLAAAGTERFGLVEVALTTAVLTILVSRIEFETQKDEQGRVTWRFHYTKPGLKEAAKPLVEKLVSLLQG